MFSLDRIHDPGTGIFTVGIVVLALIAASIPMIRMIGWWIDGGVEPLLAAVSIFLYLVLIAFAMTAPPALAVVIFLVIVASAILSPMVGKLTEEKHHQRIRNEQLSGYAEALEQNPMNPAARIALAEGLYKRGDVDLAIEHMSWTLQNFPALAKRVRPTLDGWLKEKQRAGAARLIFCHVCHAENLPDAVNCEECGARFGTRAGVRHAVALSGGPMVVIRGWLTVSLSLIIACVLLALLPIEFAAPIVLATTIVAVWLFLRWVGGMGSIGN